MLTHHAQVLNLFSLCENTIEHKKLQKIIYIAKSFGAVCGKISLSSIRSIFRGFIRTIGRAVQPPLSSRGTA
ncbi:hypothetical protein JCM19047_1149 [Bacillus sp. JCM 19047]|nr:hypothetical protein JCM19047_1149 [Bacillus sp. JCM 19047]